MTDTEWAYAAGLLDGEGNIVIGVDRRKARGYHHLQVRISNTNPLMLVWLYERWHGSIHAQTRRPGWKPVSSWVLSGGSAASFLEGVLPYTITKSEQIEIALAFRETVIGNPRRAMVDVSVRDQRERLRQRLKGLTKRGLEVI